MPRSGNVTHIVVCSDIRPIRNGICAICSVCRLVADTVGCRLDLHIARDRIDRTVVDDTIICFGGDRDIPCDRADAGRLAVGRDLLRQLFIVCRKFLIVRIFNFLTTGTLNGNTAFTSCCADSYVVGDRIDHAASADLYSPLLRTDRDVTIDRLDLARVIQTVIARCRRYLHRIRDQLDRRIQIRICIDSARTVVSSGCIVTIVHASDLIGVIYNILLRPRTRKFGRSADAVDLAAVPQRILVCAGHGGIFDGADLGGIGNGPGASIAGRTAAHAAVIDAISACDRCPCDLRDGTAIVIDSIVAGAADIHRADFGDRAAVIDDARGICCTRVLDRAAFQRQRCAAVVQKGIAPLVHSVTRSSRAVHDLAGLGLAAVLERQRAAVGQRTGQRAAIQVQRDRKSRRNGPCAGFLIVLARIVQQLDLRAGAAYGSQRLRERLVLLARGHVLRGVPAIDADHIDRPVSTGRGLLRVDGRAIRHGAAGILPVEAIPLRDRNRRRFDLGTRRACRGGNNMIRHATDLDRLSSPCTTMACINSIRIVIHQILQGILLRVTRRFDSQGHITRNIAQTVYTVGVRSGQRASGSGDAVHLIAHDLEVERTGGPVAIGHIAHHIVDGIAAEGGRLIIAAQRIDTHRIAVHRYDTGAKLLPVGGRSVDGILIPRGLLQDIALCVHGLWRAIVGHTARECLGIILRVCRHTGQIADQRLDGDSSNTVTICFYSCILAIAAHNAGRAFFSIRYAFFKCAVRRTYLVDKNAGSGKALTASCGIDGAICLKRAIDTQTGAGQLLIRAHRPVTAFGRCKKNRAHILVICILAPVISVKYIKLRTAIGN